ncbi:hypothetical protein R6Q59_024929 [Mikania micrantha]
MPNSQFPKAEHACTIRSLFLAPPAIEDRQPATDDRRPTENELDPSFGSLRYWQMNSSLGEPISSLGFQSRAELDPNSTGSIQARASEKSNELSSNSVKLGRGSFTPLLILIMF